MRKAREKGLTVSCDLNYRKNLWKYGKAAAEVKLKEGAFPAGSYVVKRDQPYARLAKIKKKYDPVAKKHVEFKESKIK